MKKHPAACSFILLYVAFAGLTILAIIDFNSTGTFPKQPNVSCIIFSLYHPLNLSLNFLRLLMSGKRMRFTMPGSIWFSYVRVDKYKGKKITWPNKNNSWVKVAKLWRIQKILGLQTGQDLENIHPSTLAARWISPSNLAWQNTGSYPHNQNYASCHGKKAKLGRHEWPR